MNFPFMYCMQHYLRRVHVAGTKAQFTPNAVWTAV